MENARGGKRQFCINKESVKIYASLSGKIDTYEYHS